MIIDVPRIKEFILTGGENRRQELKASICWNDELTRFKITKAVLALSNIANGGRIIIGVVEKNGKYEIKGMTESDFRSFNQDEVCDWMGKYADPVVNVQVQKVEEGPLKFVFLTVEEFEEHPVICKKCYTVRNEKGEQITLLNGDICTRTIGTRPRSSKVTSYADLREIIELAVKKGMRTRIKEAIETGFALQVSGKTDEEKFNEQLEAFI